VPSTVVRHRPKPAWLRVRAPGGPRYASIKARLRRLELHTVCEEARCPNTGECWGSGTATLMLMGDVCTRGCRFCAVRSGRPAPLDPDEPRHVAEMVGQMGLDLVVLTSVDRDDLPDGGADHFARTVEALHEAHPDVLVEVLVPDFGGQRDAVARVVEARPDVFAHNVETVRRLQRRVRDVRAGYALSLRVLELAKSSIMVGCGETDEEVLETLADLRAAGVDLVTIGQYLQPTPRHLPVARFVPPETFRRYAEQARQMGFLYCASGPLVRSSYRAGELFVRHVLGRRPGAARGAEEAGR